MKSLPVLLLFFPFIDAISQEISDSTFVFSGYVFDSDSIPVEGAYLLNCRTLRAVLTDSTGYFLTRVQTGDSLVINHISYKRMFVHANKEESIKNTFFISPRLYELSPVFVNNYEFELANFRKNISFIYKQLGLMEKPVDYKTGNHPSTANPYAPGASAPGFGINLLDLFPRKKRR